tara:strand:+ start:405 stop:1307 length:903 start_codon:yes stop_codon:yes gene_type:complete
MKILVYFKYIIKLLIFNPKQLLLELWIDLKKDLGSKNFKSKNKKVCIFGLPKSGTTLIEEILECLPYVRIDRSPLRFFPKKNENIFIQDPEKYFSCFPQSKFSFIKTHNMFSESFLEASNKFDVKIVVTLRDLRDMLISRYYHVISQNDHWQHKQIAHLPIEEGFIKSLTTRENGEGPEPIKYYYNWILNWKKNLKENNIRVFWYEDYISNPVNFIREIIYYLDFDQFNPKDIEKKLENKREIYSKIPLHKRLKKIGKNVSTYRAGKTQVWKSFLKKEMHNKFISLLPGPLSYVIREDKL